MASDFENLRPDVSQAGVNHFFDAKYGQGNYEVVGSSANDDGYMVRTSTGVMTAIDKATVMTHAKRAESISDMGNFNAGDMIFNTQKDLRAIGIDESMIADGVIEPRLLEKLSKQGYPMKRIVADMSAVRAVRFPNRFGRQFTKN
jgi:hypothetical protein